MKKIFTLWGRKVEPHSSCSYLSEGQASIGPPAQPGYNFRNKDLKKLHKAASAGDLEKLKQYLQLKKHDVNMLDREHRTPLHLACANGNSNIVSLLIEKQCKESVWNGANRSPSTKDGYTPLLLAITENNAEMVEFLLKRGADVNAADKNQRTALMIALSDEPSSLVSLLLQQEVDLSRQDIYGFTAEEYASFNGFTIYHQLTANYGKEISADTTLDTTFDIQELSEDV